MTLGRGTVVYAADPFKDSEAGRPWLLANTSEMPFHGEQYIGLTLSSQTWYDERLPIESTDILTGDIPEESSILPWAVASIDPTDIETEIAVLHVSLVDTAVRRLVGYLGIRNED